VTAEPALLRRTNPGSRILPIEKLTPVNGVRDEFPDYYPVIMAVAGIGVGAVPEGLVQYQQED
jgi:hypothetical protein